MCHLHSEGKIFYYRVSEYIGAHLFYTLLYFIFILRGHDDFEGFSSPNTIYTFKAASVQRLSDSLTLRVVDCLIGHNLDARQVKFRSIRHAGIEMDYSILAPVPCFDKSLRNYLSASGNLHSRRADI